MDMQVPGLTFAEAAIARSAIKYGGMDSVYIHSVVDLQSRLVFIMDISTKLD